MKKLIRKDKVAILFLLIGLMYFAALTRWSTMKSEVILDYDPWYFFRLSKEILENNLTPPKWDLKSFFPPGRPFHKQLGWPYTMILLYKIYQVFVPTVSFMHVAKLAPVMMVALCILPAYLLGKELSNDWGGLLTALFVVSAPAFIGVSMAGYCDTDAVVVFFTFLTIWSVMFAVKKRKIHWYILPVVVSMLFFYSWWFGWYVILFLTLFIPAFLVFKAIEQFIRTRKLEPDKIYKESKPVIVSLLAIIITINVVGTIFGLGNLWGIVGSGLRFLAGKAQIVNVSVAELQPINVFTRSGFMQVASRSGLIPTLIALLGLP